MKRLELGLSDVAVANRSGLSISEYADIESHEREIFENVRLRHVRRICDALGLDILVLLGIEPAGTPARAHSARHSIVGARRTALGLSRAQLAELIGFEDEAIDAIESSDESIEEWPVDVIQELARTIQVSPAVLIRAPK